ncbi:MAG: hypothetical protein AAF356_11650 [Planctomycetota bacterium]
MSPKPQANQPEQGSAEKDRPIRAVKIGNAQVAIWRNLTQDGNVVFNATIERLYYDEKLQKWASTKSFGRNDMLSLAKAVDLAHSQMCELHEQANRHQRVQAQAANEGPSR